MHHRHREGARRYLAEDVAILGKHADMEKVVNHLAGMILLEGMTITYPAKK
jgi:hypothetical protein